MASKSTARALPPAATEFGIRFESDQEAQNATLVGARLGVAFPGLMLGHPGVAAFISAGQWVAACPRCQSARNVHPDRLWWCPCCGDGAVDVRWPDEARDICAVLALRPMAARNWHPDEIAAGRDRPYLVEDLAVENLERGLPVPPMLAARVDAFLAADWTARGLAGEMAKWAEAVA